MKYYFREDLKKKLPNAVSVPHKKIMLSLNEGSLNPLSTLAEKFIEKLSNIEINRYFSNVTEDLLRNLAEYIGPGITEKNILFGNGADQMLYYLFTAVRDNKESYILSLSPSYFDYKSYSASVNLKYDCVMLDRNFDFNPEEFVHRANTENCKLAVICNPNNPTGNLFEDKKIDYVLDNAKCLVLIDETYFEFSGRSYVSMLNKYENLLIIRSFSKSFSAAGLRFGYLVSSERNIYEISKVFTVFNTSLLVQSFALTLLENRNLLFKYIDGVKKTRDVLYKNMSNLPNVKVHKSDTNFLIFSLGEKTNKFHDYLSKMNISVRNVSNPTILQNYLRVTIGCQKEIDYFTAQLIKYLEESNDK